MVPSLQELWLYASIAVLLLAVAYTVYNVGTWLAAFASVLAPDDEES